MFFTLLKAKLSVYHPEFVLLKKVFISLVILTLFSLRIRLLIAFKLATILFVLFCSVLKVYSSEKFSVRTFKCTVSLSFPWSV